MRVCLENSGQSWIEKLVIQQTDPLKRTIRMFAKFYSVNAPTMVKFKLQREH